MSRKQLQVSQETTKSSDLSESSDLDVPTPNLLQPVSSLNVAPENITSDLQNFVKSFGCSCLLIGLHQDRMMLLNGGTLLQCRTQEIRETASSQVAEALTVPVVLAGTPLVLIAGVGNTKSAWTPCLLKPLAAGDCSSTLSNVDMLQFRLNH